MTSVTFDAIRAKLEARKPARIVDPLAVQAAVALILAPAKPVGWEALFIRRAEVSGDPWSGHMALPGGRRHAEDRDLLATATRETREELGVELGADTHLGELDDFTPRTPVLPRIVVRPHVFALPSRPELNLSGEVAASFWISLQELRRSYRTLDLDVRGSKMTVQAFVIGPNVVWGLTERIVSPFLELIDPNP